METRNVGIRWIKLLLGPGVSCRSICEDRILATTMASREDAQRLQDVFGLCISASLRYTDAVDRPGFGDALPSSCPGAITDNDAMTRWFRSYWAEEDTWFYFEADADGWVTRQVEFQGPLEKPIAAASLTEREAAQQAGTLPDYEATFGATAEVPVHEWDPHDPQELTVGEFESVWLTARSVCQARARARSTRGA